MSEYQFTTQELETEEWRPVVGYEGVYSVSNLGRVRREKKAPGARIGRILKQHFGNSGYLGTSLCVDGQEIRYEVHTLVCSAFIGPKPKGKNVNHIDGIKYNNKLENLEYLTFKENHRHACSMGFISCGEKHYRSRLSESEVIEIRILGSIGIKPKVIAPMYGIHVMGIYRILDRTNWKHI